MERGKSSLRWRRICRSFSFVICRAEEDSMLGGKQKRGIREKERSVFLSCSTLLRRWMKLKEDGKFIYVGRIGSNEKYLLIGVCQGWTFLEAVFMSFVIQPLETCFSSFLNSVFIRELCFFFLLLQSLSRVGWQRFWYLEAAIVVGCSSFAGFLFIFIRNFIFNQRRWLTKFTSNLDY